MTRPMSMKSTLDMLNKEIALIKQKAPLGATHLTVLGASKGQDIVLIEEYIKFGMVVFGENRVQEAEKKWPELKKRYPGVQLHLIGPLQTNKAKAAVALFDAIQTVDRENLVEALAEAMEKTGKYPVCHIQVNTGQEPQKSGISPMHLDALLERCRQLRLPVAGLMCIPPANQPPAPHFALLRKLAKRHGLGGLSMGMSEDYQTAIRMGSTCVRLGRALFGERK